MAEYTPEHINIGVDANDGTGDPWRNGWSKVNSNLDAIESDLGDRALAADLTAETTARESAITELQASLAGKADVGSADDLTTSFVHYDTAQDVTNSERAQLAANSGANVTLPFLLVDGLTDPVSGSFNLPFLPADFYLVDMFLTLSQRTVGTGGTFEIAYGMTNGANTVGGKTSTPIDATGKLNSTIVIAGRLLAGGAANTLTITVADTETGAPVHKGLTLWLRGVWAQP